MMIVSYNPVLVAASVALALMAAFVGLSLTNGLSRLSPVDRKARISRGAIAIGGGIWATHFVAMLAVDLPVEVFYDPVFTFGSMLTAILFVGAGLLIVHFGERSRGKILAAGAVMGLGISAMHYVGMFGLRGCVTFLFPAGYVVSTAIAVAMSIGALTVAYRVRGPVTIATGAAIYGLAILATHFSAMSWTGFAEPDGLTPTTRLVPQDVLALFVSFAAFLICGAFLLTTAGAGEFARSAGVASAPVAADSRRDAAFRPEPARDATVSAPRLPYEAEGATFLVHPRDVVSIRSDGHYAHLNRVDGVLFCPMAISRLEADLADHGFLRTHRSWLVNIAYVAGFERKKDEGACRFDPKLGMDPVPVSRANVSKVMDALGI